MKVFLFGAGAIGKHILEVIGRDAVYAFIDNNRDKVGKSFQGKKIYSLEAACLYLNDAIVIISTSILFQFDIAAQLRAEGFYNYMFWEEMTNIHNKNFSQKCIDFLSNKETEVSRLNAEINICRRELEKVKYQKDYLVSHACASSMKPATGLLRKRQLELVKYSSDLFELLDDSIHPILAAGNLLGLIRHGGFIPWDDDIDFKLVREEYDRLVRFYKEKFYSAKYVGRNVYSGGIKDLDNWIDGVIQEHQNETILIETPYHTQLWRGNSFLDSVYVDFFVIDAYKDDYSFYDHKIKLSYMRERILKAESCKEVYEIIEEFQNDDRNHWSNINAKNFFYGFDNVESYDYYVNNDNWITREMIFPLKRVNYEGAQFYIPNNPEECMKYVFGQRYMELPDNIALHRHTEDCKE